jgi:hypothetical protein
MTTTNRYPGVCEQCNANVPAGAGALRREMGKPNQVVVHNGCAPDYDEIVRWMAAAGRAELIAKGRNPDRMGEDALIWVARGSKVLVLLHLFPHDGHRRFVDQHPIWDIDALPAQGWVEYPVPGTARVLINPEVGAATIHPLTAYSALNVPEADIPRSNTTDGAHVVIHRLKGSASLAREILAGAASAIQEQDR